MLEVTVLTREDCAFCDQAKEILARLAQEYQLSLCELDLDSPAGQEMAERGGVMFPPGIFLADEPFSYGRLSEKKLRRELDRRLSSASFDSAQ